VLKTNYELKKRIEFAEEKQRRPGFTKFRLLHDPTEDEEPLSLILQEVCERAIAEVNAELDRRIRMGRCHAVRKRMKRILKEEHTFDWYSPGEMNPQVRID
jgi:hypothetical protein